MKRGAIFVALAMLCAAPSRADSVAPTAAIDSGTLAGTQDGAVAIFKGIPYAAAPVGPLRWQPPAPASAWTGTRDASAFGPICPQPKRTDAAAPAEQTQSEDCLFLNVWAPAHARKAPVMVWIHGGAFRFGSGSSRFYDGTDFAKDGVVLVTLNYRLGALGFFAHPALTKAAAPDAPLGNYGIMDQLAALQWVKRNIAAFGGDPANVTVFGESAGGVSVLSLLSIPQAKGLFAKAIVESGAGWQARRGLADEEQSGITLAQTGGVGPGATADQLRGLSIATLLAEPITLAGSSPFQDGRLIKESTAETFSAGHELGVPLIIGSNSDEASLMRIFKIPAAVIAAQVPADMKSLYPGDVDAVAAAVFNDNVMGAPARWIAAQSSTQAPAYLYHFSYVPTARRSSVPGAGHGSEIPFVFGNWPAIYNNFASADDHAMETLMHSCWVAFAKTGTPKCGGMDWPAYSPDKDELMEFGLKSGPEAGFRKPQYDALQHVTLPRLVSGG